MNKFSKIFFILMASSLAFPYGWAGEHNHEMADHGQHAGEQGHEGGIIKLSSEQIWQAGLKITTVEPTKRTETLRAPGIVRYNDYKTADVTSLIEATVDSRHVKLGEAVRKGGGLITLKSTALAQAEADWIRAQAEYRKNRQEFERVKPLAVDGIVSQARLQQSRSAYESAMAQQLATQATLVSYGLSERDIEGLEAGKNFGLVTLRAPINGTVVADDVVIGQHIPAGALLMRIIDEKNVWVEVNLPPAQLQHVEIGVAASLPSNGEREHMRAKVVGIHHELDAATRTAVVRLEVDNSSHALHAGMFVDAEISIGRGQQALLLPETAIQRQGNERIVFVEEEPGHFERREVEVNSAGMGQVEIHSGVKVGERVVTEGAFVLLSELLKSGFEAHNH